MTAQPAPGDAGGTGSSGGKGMIAKEFAPVVVAFTAGPLFSSFAGLFELAFATTSHGLASQFGAVLLLSIPFGFLLSIVPIVVGSITMSLLSQWHGWASSQFAWTGAGALAAAAIGVASFGSADRPLILVLAATGACCAWLCNTLIAPR